MYDDPTLTGPTKICPRCTNKFAAAAKSCPTCPRGQSLLDLLPRIAVFSLTLIILVATGFALKGLSESPETPPIDDREARVERLFSAWDGSMPSVVKAIKSQMNNPNSFEHVATHYIDKGDHLLIQTEFRGTNAFGGVVPNTVVAKVSLDGKLLGGLGRQ